VNLGGYRLVPPNERGGQLWEGHEARRPGMRGVDLGLQARGESGGAKRSRTALDGFAMPSAGGNKKYRGNPMDRDVS